MILAKDGTPFNLSDKANAQYQLLDDFLLFTRVLYQIKNGREFKLSQPISNESHFVTVAKALTDVFNGKIKRLYIGLPPGAGKSELSKFFIAWALCHYPDSKFLYISYADELATKHTYDIRETIKLPIIKKMFGLEIKKDSSAKSFFSTTGGGTVGAFGSGGSVTGFDSGMPNVDRFSGGTFIDDFHKPKDVHSSSMRDSISRNYDETILMRCRSPNVPIVIIAQRLHEDDAIARIVYGDNSNEWTKIVIPALTELGHSMYPDIYPVEMLLNMKEKKPYVFWSQMQQKPTPAGGSLFLKEWFPILDEEPKILSTFITVDTAETDKDYSDYTAFSFWGVYQVMFNGIPIEDTYALHWIGCRDIKIQVKDLEDEFLDFMTNCMMHDVKPKLVAIEKKSTGPTLIAALRKVPGIRVEDIPRNGISKGKRFVDMQPYICEQKLSFTKGANHIARVIDHMSKITENSMHKYDDICDTAYDAIKMALIDKVILAKQNAISVNYNEQASSIMSNYNRIDKMRRGAWGK